VSWLYDQASCLAEPITEGVIGLCPTDRAFLILLVVGAAFLTCIGWICAEGAMREYRRLKRRREFGLHDDG
jgi:hypothetical protein